MLKISATCKIIIDFVSACAFEKCLAPLNMSCKLPRDYLMRGMLSCRPKQGTPGEGK